MVACQRRVQQQHHAAETQRDRDGQRQVEFILVHDHREHGEEQRGGIVECDGGGERQHGDAVEEQHERDRAGNAAPQVGAPMLCGNADALLAHDEIDHQQAEERAVEHQLDMREVRRAEFDEYAHAAEQQSGDQHPE